MTRMLDNLGPFYMRRLPYRLGFRWRGDYELQPGATRSTWDIPRWAQSSTADIVGTWKADRYRLYWRHIPIGRWRHDWPKFRGGGAT